MARLSPFLVALPLALGPLRAGTAAAAPYGFVKGPYIQSLSARSVVVRWEGSEPATGSVTVMGAGVIAKLRAGQSEEPALFHSIQVDDLTPGSTYRYAAAANDAKSGDGTFTTPKDEDGTFVFQVYGDNRNDHVAHAAVVGAMRARPASFAVHTGDMVAAGNNPADWATFFRVEGSMLRDRCVFACVGNHELVGGPAAFMRYFHPDRLEPGTLAYSTRWGNSRFFLLNAFSTLRQGKERAWLEGALLAADTEEGIVHRFLVLHQGPASSGPHGPGAHFDEGLSSLLRRHHITMIFAGHDHLYERGERDGLRYIISGGAGAPLYAVKAEKSPPTQAAESAHHFVEVQIEGAKVVTRALRKDGSLMDRCVIEGAAFTCDPTSIAVHRDPITGAVAPPPKKRSCDCALPGAPPSDFPAVVALFPVLAVFARQRLASGTRALLPSGAC